MGDESELGYLGLVASATMSRNSDTRRTLTTDIDELFEIVDLHTQTIDAINLSIDGLTQNDETSNETFEALDRSLGALMATDQTLMEMDQLLLGRVAQLETAVAALNETIATMLRSRR